MKKYLNKNVRFRCQNGNAVWFQAKNGNKTVSINGAEILLDDCILNLTGAPHQGQCNLLTDPSTGVPSPCGAINIKSSWSNSTTLTVSGKKALNSACSISCLRQGTIKPFEQTFESINVDDSSIPISLGNIKSIDFDSHQTNNTEKQNTLKEYKQNKEIEDILYATCNYRNCPKAKNCQYLKTSYQLKESNESKNAKILRNNMGKDFFDLYTKECRLIATTHREIYSIVHHHIIPVNQCFKNFPELIKLANYYNYDINNTLNGIYLPTMNEGYDKQPVEKKIRIAFIAMEKLEKQWHKGGHIYQGKLNEIEKISKDIDEHLKDLKPFKDYKTSVDEYLQQFSIKIFEERTCKANKEEAKNFCNTMNHISKKIALRLQQFISKPSKSIFVSKMSFYYAYYDILKKYQSILFSEN